MAEQLVEPRLELATVRGIACVALVAYHVVGINSASGMHLPESSSWHLAMDSLDFLRMPMFSVLAGFLYAANRVKRGSLASFLDKKALRLLAPLLFVTTVMFVLRRATYHETTTYYGALFFHYQHLWFLQSLLLIFAAVALWDTLAPPGWVELSVVGFGAVMVSRTFQVTDLLSINGALYLLPFFALGMILRTEPALLRSRNLITLACALVAIVMVMRQASDALGGNAITRVSLPAALCGAGAAYLMLVCCPKVRIFEAIGHYSFTIYLWHSIASSAARHALRAYSHLPTPIEFAILLTAGVAAPIAIHLVIRHIPIICTLAAGIRPPAPAEKSPDMPLQVSKSALMVRSSGR